MRRRSNTLQATNFDDYLTAAQRIPAITPHIHHKVLKESNKQFDVDSCTNGNIWRPEDDPVPADKPICPKKKPNKMGRAPKDATDHWTNFDFENEGSWDQDEKKDEDPTKIPSMSISDNTVDTDYSDDAEEGEKHPKVSVLKRIMVIGFDGAGKHSLINETFQCGQEKLKNKNQIMDLLTKTEEDEEDRSEMRYQFWIRNLKKDICNNKLENLIKVYYKNVSLFVFMYSVTDKKTFEGLENAIQAVMKDVPEEKFAGVLLGTKMDLEKDREVPASEGILLQEKYKLMFFLETHQEDKLLKERLSLLLHEVEGGMAELKSRKGFSILSTD